jgi:hypothetical protein
MARRPRCVLCLRPVSGAGLALSRCLESLGCHSSSAVPQTKTRRRSPISIIRRTPHSFRITLPTKRRYSAAVWSVGRKDSRRNGEAIPRGREVRHPGAGDRRGRLRQRRGRQIDRRRQPGAGAESQRPRGRGARRRHLWFLDAAHARDRRAETALARRQVAAAARELRAAGDVDGVSGRRGHADDLAREFSRDTRSNGTP